jgi:ABC-2 type transport system permease protein
MHHIPILLRTRIWSIKNTITHGTGKGSALKPVLLGGIGALFWAGIFFISIRVLNYFRGIDDIGYLVAQKLLSMMMITIFSLLIFSAILAVLSKLYLSKDLPLIHAMPVLRHRIFIARWFESTIDSAWMVMVYSLPVLIAYGIVFNAGAIFYVSLPLVLFPLIFFASGVSALLVLIAVLIVPAGRIKTLFVFLGLTLFIVLYLAFRLLRPERLVDPEAFSTVLVYIQMLNAPSVPYLPSTWAFDALRAYIEGELWPGIFHTALAWSGTVFVYFVLIIVADKIYFRGLSATQTARDRLFRINKSGGFYFRFLPGPLSAFITKEIKTFFRDQTQWSQIFLIGALVVIYIYNFKVLPLERSPMKTEYLQNLLSFMNMGLVAFVLIAVAARFAYPAVSIEGESFWLVQTTPISMRQYLWIKFFVYFLPLLFFAELLIVGTNILLKVTPLMMVLSIVTIFLMVPGIVCLGIGLGAAYPDFKSENPNQSVTSMGGLLFMVLSAGYAGAVIALEAGPVYNLFMSSIKGSELRFSEWIWIVGSFLIVLTLSIAAVIVPMRFGEKRLQHLEN